MIMDRVRYRRMPDAPDTVEHFRFRFTSPTAFALSTFKLRIPMSPEEEFSLTGTAVVSLISPSSFGRKDSVEPRFLRDNFSWVRWVNLVKRECCSTTWAARSSSLIIQSGILSVRWVKLVNASIWYLDGVRWARTMIGTISLCWKRSSRWRNENLGRGGTF